jgi:hypothetical protein
MAKHLHTGTRIGSLIVLYCACISAASAVWAATPEAGSPAPAFRLQDQAGRVAKHYASVDPKGHSLMVLADLKVLQAK